MAEPHHPMPRPSLLLRLALGLLALSSYCLAADKEPKAKPYSTNYTTGTIQLYAHFPSANVRTREVYVWLPPSYKADGNQRYPVLYMHDGQCLFDPSVSLSGTEWCIDETMTALVTAGQVREAIIVGVGNTVIRSQEYVPAKPLRRILGTGSAAEKKLKEQAADLGLPVRETELRSDAYLKFLVTELKPFIDQHYRTLADRDNTLIAGSSLGGQISLYAICEYPDTFGSAACISTHWPVGDGAMIDYLAEKGLPFPSTHRLYFDFGTATLDAEYEPYQQRMDALLLKAGYREGQNWRTLKFPGAAHSESAWATRAQVYLKFLLGKQ